MTDFRRSATFKRRHAAKLQATLGPAPVTKTDWFLPWMLYMKVGTPGGYKRPAHPRNIRQAEFPGFFQESARIDLWRQRKQAGIPRPARGIWVGARLPAYAATVSKEMDRVGIPKPVPRPPTPTPVPAPNALLVQRAQKVVFSAWRPLDAFVSHGGGRVTFAADLNCGGNSTQHVEWVKQAVGHAKDVGREPSIWGNQSQVGIDHMFSFAGQVGAAYIIWQAETIGEMIDVGVNADGSIRAGSPISKGDIVLIGNANAWTPQQRETVTRLIHEGRIGYIQETYTNTGDPWPENYGTQGVPAASISPGVGWDKYPHQLPIYKVHTPGSQWPTISPYLAEDFDDTSRAVMPY